MKIKLMLFDNNENYITDIKDIITAKHIEELNGEDSLYLEVIDTEAEKGHRILVHDRNTNKFNEFIIFGINEYKEGKVIIKEIYAENSISETIGDFIEDKRIINKPIFEAVEKALENTRWDKGIIEGDDLGLLVFYRTNVRAAIDKIVTEYFVELETIIKWNKKEGKIERKINFLKERGKNRGNRLTYTRNLIEIKRNTLQRDIYTALYGFGKGEESGDGYGRAIDFSSINNGKAYVENLEAKDTWGRLDKSGVNKVHTFGKVEFDNITDRKKLLERTKEELEKLSKPAVSYTARLLDFFSITKSEHDYIELGDTVKILDRDFSPSINYNTRVFKIERDLLNIENTEIILGELVRNLADREKQQEEDLEKILEDNYLQDGDIGGENGDGGDVGVLPTYERAVDLVKNNETLKIGLSSWIDINEPKSLILDGGGNVLHVKDALDNEIVYSQNEDGRQPKLKEMYKRRWLSFNPDPMTLNKWLTNQSRPENSIKQEGQYLNYSKDEDMIKTIFIVYYDRTPEPIGEGSAYGSGRIYEAENIARVGASCPFSYQGIKTSSYSYYTGMRHLFYYQDENILGKREREEVMIKSNRLKGISYRKLPNLGMNKDNYDSYSSIIDNTRAPYSYAHMRYETNAFYKGEIAEVILYNRELDSEEFNIIKEYLEDKYQASYSS